MFPRAPEVAVYAMECDEVDRERLFARDFDFGVNVSGR
jgi:hypothetical protein